jgi:hypothetical protein
MLLSVDGTTSLSKTSMEKVATAPLEPRRLSPETCADVGVTGSFPAEADGGGGGGSSPPPRGAVIFAAAPPPPRARSPGRSASCIGLGLAPAIRRDSGGGREREGAGTNPKTSGRDRERFSSCRLRLGSPSRGNKRKRREGSRVKKQRDWPCVPAAYLYFDPTADELLGWRAGARRRSEASVWGAF